MMTTVTLPVYNKSLDAVSGQQFASSLLQIFVCFVCYHVKSDLQRSHYVGCDLYIFMQVFGQVMPDTSYDSFINHYHTLKNYVIIKLYGVFFFNNVCSLRPGWHSISVALVKHTLVGCEFRHCVKFGVLSPLDRVTKLYWV